MPTKNKIENHTISHESLLVLDIAKHNNETKITVDITLIAIRFFA